MKGNWYIKKLVVRFMPMESKEYHIIGFKTTCISAHSRLKLKILDQMRKQ